MTITMNNSCQWQVSKSIQLAYNWNKGAVTPKFDPFLKAVVLYLIIVLFLLFN